MTWEQKTGEVTYQVTETTYTFPDTPGEYRIIRRHDSRFMDVEYRTANGPFLGPWTRIDTTDLTEKAICLMESHAERVREAVATWEREAWA